MSVYVSYLAEEDRIDLIFRENLDLSLSHDVLGICRSVSPNVKSCIIDLSGVNRVFDSGIALLQLLYLRLSELGVIVVILSDQPEPHERIPFLARKAAYSSPVWSSIQGRNLIKTDLKRARQGIGTRLREARTAKGLTQAELGKLAGLNQTVVQRVENGMLWHPSVVSGLAVAMDIPPAWVQWGEPFSDKRVE